VLSSLQVFNLIIVVFLVSHSSYTPFPSHLRFDHPNNIWWSGQFMKLLIMQPSAVRQSNVVFPLCVTCINFVTRIRNNWSFNGENYIGIFLFTTASRLALWPTQHPAHWAPGILSLGIKRPGREAYHSPPSSTEVKISWSCTSTPQYALMVWCSVKAQGQLLSLYANRVISPKIIVFCRLSLPVSVSTNALHRSMLYVITNE
jgi:hypothetical protein